YGQGLAVGDYDNDGFPDVFVASYGGCRLFHNTRGRKHEAGGRRQEAGKAGPATPLFEDETEQAGIGDREHGPRWASGAAWGDYDGDGRLDLIVIHYAAWRPETDKKCTHADGKPAY